MEDATKAPTAASTKDMSAEKMDGSANNKPDDAGIQQTTTEAAKSSTEGDPMNMTHSMSGKKSTDSNKDLPSTTTQKSWQELVDEVSDSKPKQQDEGRQSKIGSLVSRLEHGGSNLGE